MTLTEVALKRTRVTLVLLGVLLLSGVSAYLGMPQKMDPGFIIRTAQIVTYFPGASPDRVEQLVTDPLEQAVQAIPELDFVSSTSRAGVSIVAVNVLEKYKNVRPIWDDLRRKIDAAKGELPTGIAGPFINDELGDTYPMLFSMTADGFTDRESREIAESIRDQLLRIDGVAKVDMRGAQEERVFVEYNDARLASLGLSTGALKSVLQARNIIMPGGEVDIGRDTLVLEPSGNFLSIDELRQTLIQLPNGNLTYLRDIADVTRGYVDPPKGMVTARGLPAITFAVSMSDEYNLVDLGTRVRTFFDELPAYYPHGIDFELTYFQPKDVEVKVDEFISNVVQAVIIVLVVMLLTLGMRTGFVVSALIPAAMVITIWVLSLIGESIHQMSLAALIIALGLLVDNAIVVTESILVRLNAGEERMSAAVAACKELQVPLLVSSLTTAAAFLPIYLAESMVGEYTGALFVVVSITLLVSWLLALTMTPMLCVTFLKAGSPDDDKRTGFFYRLFRRVLSTALRNRAISLGLVVLAFVLSLQLWALVPSIFFPSQGSPFFVAAFNLPAGTSMATTAEMSKRIDKYMKAETLAKDGGEGVTSWTTFIGETPPPFTLGFIPSPSQGGYCELMVHTTSTEVVPALMDKLRRFGLDEFPDVHTHIRMLSSGPPVDKPVQVRVSGPDTETVFQIVDRIKAALLEIPGSQNVDDNWGSRTKKLVVRIDEERARRAQVSHEEIARAMQTFLSGLEVTRYREDDESIPVVIRSVASDRRNLDRIKTLSIYSAATRRSVPLSQVAEISLAMEPSSVLRRDRYRTVTVEGGVAGDVTAMEVFNKIRPWLEKEKATWPIGYHWQFGGEIESSQKANASIADKLPIAGLVIILLLVIQFNSIRRTGIVLSSIVLAMIGVVIGLVVLDSSFGFMTLLGVISLAGIVINNAIVLLDRIRIEIEENGLAPERAVVEAAEQRARPILLTTATTVASLIPLYLTGGAMWRPMSVAIMAGLIFSTILTLLVVPLLYSVLYRVPNVPKAPAVRPPEEEATA